MPSVEKRTMGVKEHLDTVKPVPVGGGRSAQNVELELKMMIMMKGSPMLLRTRSTCRTVRTGGGRKHGGQEFCLRARDNKG